MEKNLFKNKVFIDNDSYSNFFKYGVIILCVLIFGILGWGLYVHFETGKDTSLSSTAICMLVVFIFIWLTRWTTANAFIYSMYNGVLFRIVLPNEMGRDGIAMEGLGSLTGNQETGILAGGAMAVAGVKVREQQQNRMAEDDAFLEKILQQGYSQQVLQVLSIKRFGKGYKVKMRCTAPGMVVPSMKTSFYIFPGYNDYEELIEYFKYFKDHTTEKINWK